MVSDQRRRSGRGPVRRRPRRGFQEFRSYRQEHVALTVPIHRFKSEERLTTSLDQKRSLERLWQGAFFLSRIFPSAEEVYETIQLPSQEWQCWLLSGCSRHCSVCRAPLRREPSKRSNEQYLWRPANACKMWGDLFNRPVCDPVRSGVLLGKERQAISRLCRVGARLVRPKLQAASTLHTARSRPTSPNSTTESWGLASESSSSVPSSL